MDIDGAFPSKWLAAGDLRGQEVHVKMADVRSETVGTAGEFKPVLYFIGKAKGLVLNKTNAKKISHFYGHETDHWHGQPLILYPSETDFAGDTVPCIRVKIPSDVAPPGQAAQAPVDSGSFVRPPIVQPNAPVDRPEEPFDDDISDIPF